MSTRRERANRWWLRCPKCRAWKAAHLDPWTKTYVCERTRRDDDWKPIEVEIIESDIPPYSGPREYYVNRNIRDGL